MVVELVSADDLSEADFPEAPDPWAADSDAPSFLLPESPLSLLSEAPPFEPLRA